MEDVKHARENNDDQFHIVYQQPESLAKGLSVDLAIPRSTSRQMNRNNVLAENQEQYYQRALALPLIDRIISEMLLGFNSLNIIASTLLLLVPPNKVVGSTSTKSSVRLAIKVCDKQKFPNIFDLPKIGCTLAVTSAECKYSFSAMRRFRIWLRCSMKSDCKRINDNEHTHKCRSE